MEAAFSDQHSAVSEKQNQHQRPFTAKDAEDAKEEKVLSRNHGKPGDEEERVQQRAEALAVKLAQTYEELTRLLERNPAMKRHIDEAAYNGGHGGGRQGLPEAETAAEDG
jgi:hypothetical protein